MLLLVACTPSAVQGPVGPPFVPPDDTETPTGSPPTPTDTTTATGTAADFLLEIGQPGTLVWASWTADGPIADTSVVYSFEDGEWSSTPVRDVAAGDQRQVLLGIPASTTVYAYLTGFSNGVVWQSETLDITTDDLPSDLVSPPTVFHDPNLASPERWMIGTIDVSSEGWWNGPFYFFVMDREGRYVWWRKFVDRRTNFPQVGATGTYIAVDATALDIDDSALHRMTLDGESEEIVPLPGFVWSFTEGPDGTLFYDADHDLYGPVLMERAPDGTTRIVWECATAYGPACATNTVKYDPARDAILWSMYDLGTVVEIDRASGTVLRQWGTRPGSWSFDPPDVAFLDQHWPNYTPDGTLLVSTHLPDVPYEQRAFEFEVDDATQTLRLVWSYGEGVDEYAFYSGDAHRVSNGNTLVNYGTGGALREVTPDGEIAFLVDWNFTYVLGHNELVDDLYALLQLPE